MPTRCFLQLSKIFNFKLHLEIWLLENLYKNLNCWKFNCSNLNFHVTNLLNCRVVYSIITYGAHKTLIQIISYFLPKIKIHVWDSAISVKAFWYKLQEVIFFHSEISQTFIKLSKVYCFLHFKTGDLKFRDNVFCIL